MSVDSVKLPERWIWLQQSSITSDRRLTIVHACSCVMMASHLKQMHRCNWTLMLYDVCSQYGCNNIAG